jgi:low temperature requirement protein LtrA
MLFGGPALFLVARAWYQWRVFGTAERPQLVTIGVLAALAVAAGNAPAILAALATVVVLAGLAIAEHIPNTSSTN